jgi:hypothetical protein
MRSDHPAAETPLPFTVHDAMEQAETGHAAADQVRMAQDVAGMFDELRAMADRYAELHADRARLRAELEQARRRWWHRWFKR